MEALRALQRTVRLRWAGLAWGAPGFGKGAIEERLSVEIHGEAGQDRGDN